MAKGTKAMIEVKVSLSPNGTLQVAFPGSNGDRYVPLKPGHEVEILIRILLARSHEIGSEGAPTTAQALHWAKHQIFPDSRCAFCRAEAKDRERLRALEAAFLAKGGEIKGKITRIDLEELGL